ncbi:MAG: hypothetical protein OHK0012_10610 [Synechococcales cyanobacterium]
MDEIVQAEGGNCLGDRSNRHHGKKWRRKKWTDHVSIVSVTSFPPRRGECAGILKKRNGKTVANLDREQANLILIPTLSGILEGCVPLVGPGRLP